MSEFTGPQCRILPSHGETTQSEDINLTSSRKERVKNSERLR